ncbi:hypothetical protein K438DRAFT_1933371 [Mycena galopus ATCC 62051]|nr:hypothetical protein K438DRAFT_1933371 [Mycena galopus ATCC 62051]
MTKVRKTFVASLFLRDGFCGDETQFLAPKCCPYVISRAWTIADANILLTEPNKSKGSLHPSTLKVLKWARKNNHCPTFHTFWINKGWKSNHNNICLELSLKEMLGFMCRGLDIRKREHGEVEEINGFIKAEDN